MDSGTTPHPLGSYFRSLKEIMLVFKLLVSNSNVGMSHKANSRCMKIAFLSRYMINSYWLIEAFILIIQWYTLYKIYTYKIYKWECGVFCINSFFEHHQKPHRQLWHAACGLQNTSIILCFKWLASILDILHFYSNYSFILFPQVDLANSISRRIREKQGEISDDETIRFKSYLVRFSVALYHYSWRKIKFNYSLRRDLISLH